MSKNFARMDPDQQSAYIREQRGRPVAVKAEAFVFCGSPDCQVDLTSSQCLRVSFSPPGKPWASMRFCDLVCLLDFLITEEDADGEGLVFTAKTQVDSLSP